MAGFNSSNRSDYEGLNTNRASSQDYYDQSDEYDDGYTADDLYRMTLKDLWMCIGFCIVGWVVFCIGNVLMYSNDLGILLMLIGVIIVDLPCIKILLAGGSLGMVFGSIVGAERIIYYTDGTKRRDNSAWSAGLAVTIFTWLVTLIVGAVAMVIRIFKDFFDLLKLKNSEGVRTDAKSAPWLPVVVGIAVFIAGFIGINVATGIMDYEESVRDEYSDEDTLLMLDGISGGMKENNWQYVYWSGSEKALTVEHQYNAVEQYDLIMIKIAESGTEVFGLDAGSYIIQTSNNGVTEYGTLIDATSFEPADEALKAKLISFTPDELFGYEASKADVAKVYAYATNYEVDYDENELNFTYKTAGPSGSLTEYRAGKSGGVWQIRVLYNPFSWTVDGYIEFDYRGYDSIID